MASVTTLPTSTPSQEKQPKAGLDGLAKNTGSEGAPFALLQGTGVGGGGTVDFALGCGACEGDPNKGAMKSKGADHDPLAGAPEVTDEKAEIKGALDKDVVRRAIRRAMPSLRYCYEQALAATPSLQGKVVVYFVIAANGAVTSSTTTKGIQADVDACVAKKIGLLSFPAPSDGKEVKVTYPFIFARVE